MSSKQPSNLELIIANYVRNEYENKYDRQHVPIAIKYLMQKFADNIIGCRLLTVKEDIDLFDVLTEKLWNDDPLKFHLLYRASEHEFDPSKFHELCDKKGATLTIIKTECGKIFGGFLSRSWTSREKCVADKNAFLFFINPDKALIIDDDPKFPLVFEIKKDRDSIDTAAYDYPDHGPSFGWDDITIDNQYVHGSYHNRESMTSYNYSGLKVKPIYNSKFKMSEYEVFQIENLD